MKHKLLMRLKMKLNQLCDSLGLQMLLLQGKDCGVDVESVENLIRRHEEMEREARVIQERGAVST